MQTLELGQATGHLMGWLRDPVATWSGPHDVTYVKICQLSELDDLCRAKFITYVIELCVCMIIQR